MKVPKSFIPEKKLDDKVNMLLNETDFDDQGLAIATGVWEGNRHEGYLYVWEPSMRDPKFVKKRDTLIMDLCYSKNKLYECGPSKKIYDVLLNEEVRTSRFSILSMCDYYGHLIYSNLDAVHIGNVVKKREGWPYALEFHDGKIYDAGSDQKVYITLEGRVVAKQKGVIRALCSHNDELYDAGSSCIVSNTLTRERIAERMEEIYTLCSFRGMLLDGGASGLVIDSFRDREFFDFGDCTVTALETIPIGLVEELKKIEATK